MMLKELKKYIKKDQFVFTANDSLSKVCNAPRKCSGIYLVFANKRTMSNLIYIGISGRIGKDDYIKHRNDGLRGRFLTGKQFGDKRQKTWPIKMKEEQIDIVIINWYVTHGEFNQDLPRNID